MNIVKTLIFTFFASLYALNLSAQEWLRADYVVADSGESIDLAFSTKIVAPKVILLGSGEPRLVLDWDNMRAAVTGQDIGQGQKAIAGEGPVTRYRYAPRGSKGMRLVMELAPQVEFAGTQNFGDRLRVRFSRPTQARQAFALPQQAVLDPFTYDVPIPRPKPSLNVQGNIAQSEGSIEAYPLKAQPQDIQENIPHDPFLYDVPMPRIKPLGQPSRGFETSQQVPVQIAAFDIYSPVKRVFTKNERPYPRTAPHIGTVQVGAIQAIRGVTPRLSTAAKTPKKPVIVIDPGHGGYDPGAIGAKGTKEKLITSAVTKRLAAALRRTGRYDIVITRTKDVYVDHDDRLRIARERGADLFISLHADSTENGKAAGASVYTLADRAKNRSKKITHTQNWIVDVDLSEQTASVGDILVDLAQRKTQSHSAEFADKLVSELEKTVPLVRNTHRRAGYYVLLAPDVPAVLLELGFISNTADEKRLNKMSEQEKIVKAVIKAINGYFNAKKP